MPENKFVLPHNSKWTTEPASFQLVKDRFVVEAKEGSDFWESTYYGFRHRNGHALLAEWDGSQAIEISFDLKSFTELYDQAGLMLWHNESHWIKAGIEINDGVPHAAVVATDQFSDWSLAPVPDWEGRIVTIRASYQNEAVIIRARTDIHGWRTIRVARFAHQDGMQAGLYVCSPKRAGFKVEFSRWELTAPDQDLHTDPAIL